MCGLSRSIFIIGAVLVTAIVPHPAKAQFGRFGLTARVPNDANAIMLLNLESIWQTPAAKSGNWRKNQENAASAGLTFLPPTATHFVLASKMDLELMYPIWEVALADLTYEPSMPKIAARRGGSIDNIAGMNAAVLADDSYVVQLGKVKLGAMRPANRQVVSNWLRSTATTKGHHLSPYLQKAVNYADHSTPIVLAVDLSDALSMSRVRKKLESFKAVEGKDVDLDELAKVLASVKGITLGLNVKDHVSGALVIEFGEDTGILKGLAKPIVLEALANQSAMIDEFNDWKEIVEEGRVRIGGRLYASGLKRIMSLLDAPGGMQHMSPDSQSGSESEQESLALLTSQQYYKSVSNLIEDLQNKEGKKNAGQVGIWWGKYAKKIDNLPMVNVDKELLDYGAFVSSSLRDGESVLRSVGGRARVRELDDTASYSYDTNYRGYYGNYYAGMGDVNANARVQAQDRARIRTEERVSGAKSARDIMQDIDAATAMVRRKMIEKYNVEF